MVNVLLAVHLMLALGLIGVILVQRSEGGGLGIGGGGGGFMTARGTANLLTRSTAILAACFMATSLALALIADREREPARSLLDEPAAATGEPAQPSAPAVPLAR
jgi:preprotein translocase subunit SecG